MSASLWIPKSAGVQSSRLAQNIYKQKSIMKLQPQNATTFTQGQPIQVVLPNQYSVNLHDAYFKFTVTLNKTGGTYVRVGNHVASLFHHHELKRDSDRILYEEELGTHRSVNYQLESSANATNIGARAMLGVGSASDRSTWGATSRTYLYFPFRYNVNDEDIHLQVLGGKWTHSLYLDQAVNCLETDGTAPSFTISNVQFICKAMTPTEQFLAHLEAQKNSGIYMRLREIQNQQTTIVAPTTKFSMTLPFRSLRRFFPIMRNQADLTDATKNDKKWQYNYNAASGYNFQINGRTYFMDDIDCGGDGAEAYFHMMDAITYGAYDPTKDEGNILADSFITTSFIPAVDFSLVRIEPDNDAVAGESLSFATNSLTYKLVLGSLPGTTQQLNCFVEIDKYLIFKGGALEIQE